MWISSIQKGWHIESERSTPVLPGPICQKETFRHSKAAQDGVHPWWNGFQVRVPAAALHLKGPEGDQASVCGHEPRPTGIPRKLKDSSTVRDNCHRRLPAHFLNEVGKPLPQKNWEKYWQDKVENDQSWPYYVKSSEHVWPIMWISSIQKGWRAYRTKRVPSPSWSLAPQEPRRRSSASSWPWVKNYWHPSKNERLL